MIYDDLLQAQLFNNSTIMALLSKDVEHPTAPALYNRLLVPEAMGKEKTTINYYATSPANTEGYGEETFTLNCRAPGELKSRVLAQSVRDELHRSNNTANNTLFVCEIQRTLPPDPNDQTDNYNTIVDIRLTTRVLR